MFKAKLHNEDGQSMILITFVILAMLAMLGLVVDGGTAYFNRRDAQNASDGAAFAGGRELRASGATDAAMRTTIDTFAAANHVDTTARPVIAYYIDQNGNEITGSGSQQIGSWGSIPGGATGVVVTSTISFPSLFMGVLNGGGPTDIRARAKVQTGQLVAPGSPLVPMVVPLPTDFNCPIDQSWVGIPNCSNLQLDQPVDLVGTTTTSGNLQWLNLAVVNPTGSVPPCNENCAAQYISQDYISVPPPPPVKIGDWLQATTGLSINKCTGGQTKDTSIICAVDYWLAKPEAERHWTVPVYKIDNGGTGNTEEYQIIAFADFIPTGYYFGQGSGWSSPSFLNSVCINPFTLQPANPTHPNNANCIQGKFEGFVIGPGEVDPTVQCNLNPLNICGIELKE